MKSRLKSHLKEKAYRNIVIVTLGILAMILFLIFFGTHILIGFSLLVDKFTGEEEATPITREESFVAPPILNTPVEATNKTTIEITGQADAKQTISLYQNSKLVDKTTVNSTNSFTFTNVVLEDGENVFKAKAKMDTSTSAYSDEVKIFFANKPPELTIDSPKDGDSFKKEQSPVKITGLTHSGATVTVNDFRAIVDDEGKFSYLYSLKDGDNNLKIAASDKAGNTTTSEINIRTE